MVIYLSLITQHVSDKAQSNSEILWFLIASLVKNMPAVQETQV